MAQGQLFFLLSERFGRPTPQRCGLSGQPLSILQPTQLKSKELEEEVTVLPDCLCVFKTKALQRCDIDPTRTKKPVPLYVWTQSLRSVDGCHARSESSDVVIWVVVQG